MIANADEATLRALFEQGLGDTEIARRIGSSARTVGRARRALGVPPPSKIKRTELLTVKVSTDELEETHRSAREAGYTTTSDWVRRLCTEVPELAREVRGPGATPERRAALGQLLEIVIGEAREGDDPRE